METDPITKSVLKKSDGLVLNKNKKVTFCDTVKVFVDNPSSISKAADVELQVKCVEITIVDNSNDHLLPPLESVNDDCSVSDFLVHKVVYDSYSVPDDDIDPDVQNEDVEEEPVLFEVQEDDDLEFIVHKVTDHEDDLIKQEIDFHVVNDDDDDIVQLPEINAYGVMQKFSKLSVENILEHDKIIAFVDQKNFPPQFENESALNIPEIDSYLIKKEVSNPASSNISKSKEELILSPPLQELSLEKIVKAHSDNVLCELDISPLNSIQETDSESDLSSEGTMIMMTSEECQKNEQHIRESLLLYQSLKEKPKTEVVVQNISPEHQITDNKIEGKGNKCSFEMQENAINEAESHSDTDQDVANINLNINKVTDPETIIKRNEEGDSIETVSDADTKNDSTQFVSVSYQQKHFQNASDNPGTGDNEQNVIKCLDVLFKKESLPGSNTSTYWDKSLASIEIPNDVREWKILLNSFDKNREVTFLEKDGVMQSKIESNADSSLKQPSLSPHRHSSHINSISKVDELENFVQESTERVERIRKRYLLSGKAQMRLGLRRHSPIRGIRPRFGSTAEILHLMQKQNQAPFLSISGLRNHMSWPCNETVNNPEVNRHNSSCIYVSQSLSGVYAHNSFSEYCDEQFNSASSDHYSISSCPSIMIHERGVPEGASPPRSLSEDCNEHLLLDNPNNVVYYSMKV